MPVAIAFAFGHSGEVLLGDDRLARVGHIDAREDVHKRRLAAAAATRDGDHRTRLDAKAEALQRDDLALGRLIDTDEAFALDHGGAHAIARTSSLSRNGLAACVARPPRA